MPPSAAGGESAAGPENGDGREPSLFTPPAESPASEAPARTTAAGEVSPDPAAGVRPDNGDGEPAARAMPVPDQEIASFLDEVSRRKQSLAAHLREAVRLEFRDGRLWIHAPAGDDWLNGRTLRRESNRRALDDALRTVWGEGAHWKLVESAEMRTASAGAAPEDAAADSILRDPRVQTVLDIFGGRVESIEEH